MAPNRPSRLADTGRVGPLVARGRAPRRRQAQSDQVRQAPAAQATTRRSDESAASSGTATIQGMRKEVMPPVSQAEKVMRPAKFAAEIRCAAPNLPVRDRKMAMPIGDRNQRKATASSSVGLPRQPRDRGARRRARAAREKMRSDEGLLTGGADDVVLRGSDAQASRNRRPMRADSIDRYAHFGAGQVAAVSPIVVGLDYSGARLRKPKAELPARDEEKPARRAC